MTDYAQDILKETQTYNAFDIFVSPLNLHRLAAPATQRTERLFEWSEGRYDSWKNGRSWTNKTTARKHGPLPFLFVVRHVVDLQLRASSTGPATQQPASTASVVKASYA
jgi:hypothetical protein